MIKNWFVRISSLGLALALLAGCHFPAILRQPDPQIFENISDLATNPVEIQFQLALPQSIEGSEKIVIEIIDDVTGLPYNSSFTELKIFSDQIYITTLTIPAGSVIKYRYAKVAQNITPEATPDGEPITYRLFSASNNAIVTDVLQAWQGEPALNATGILRGTLVDQDTRMPTPDIIVSAGGKRTFTDANGKYLLEGLGQGIHNVVFYAIDGKYRTYQQGAAIEPGMTTRADVNLTHLPEVNVTFQVSPPTDALGAPVYITGNIFQLGNTFADLKGGMSIKPKRMPVLSPNQDGSLSITLRLYAETDLRYKFTLGDGFWNAEQYLSGGYRVRQMIVPSEDVTISHTIETWRSAGVEPVTFLISIPPGSSPNDEKFIQFQADEWMEPIPLWPLGNGQFLYILYSPLAIEHPVNYRFCRQDECTRAMDTGSSIYERQFKPSGNAQTISLTLDSWQNWYRFEQGASIQDAYIPIKSANYGTLIELTPEMSSSWLTAAPKGIAGLDQIGADTVIFSPKWSVSPQSPYLHPQMGMTPFAGELLPLLNTTKTYGHSIGLYPHVGPYKVMEDWWLSKNHTEAWWNEFFSSYREFIINYAKIADISGADMLILGGKNLLPAFEGGMMPDGSESDVPLAFDNNWQELLSEIRDVYSGKILWATQVNLEIDPLPDFVYEFDGFYISVDAPLAIGEHPTFEMIQSGFTNIIDSQIYEVYRSYQKPIILATAYPSVEIAASGCALLSESCYNDGLFRPNELTPYEVNFDEQALIYNAILPIIASRDWITGISIRGYEPTVVVHDGASSVAGKPAVDVIEYWFTNMKP
jgi:hypothetical protein